MADKRKTPVAFGDLEREEQIARVRELMADKHTYKSAAKALGTSLGTVARICDDNTIATARSRKKVFKPKAEAPAPLPADQVPSPPLRPPKAAITEATQCTKIVFAGKRCAFVREPNSLFCIQHQPKKK